MLGTRRANLPMTDEVISQIHVNFVAASQLWPRVKCGRADLRILWTLNDHKPNTDHNSNHNYTRNSRQTLILI